MAAAQKPLRPQQCRAAQLLGEGRSQKEVADECGTSTTAIRRWGQRDDFKALVKQAREAVLDANPGNRATLEAARSATNKNGAPLWGVRLTAVRLLMQLDGAESEGGGEDAIRETLVFLPEGDDGES